VRLATHAERARGPRGMGAGDWMGISDLLRFRRRPEEWVSALIRFESAFVGNTSEEDDEEEEEEESEESAMLGDWVGLS